MLSMKTSQLLRPRFARLSDSGAEVATPHRKSGSKVLLPAWARRGSIVAAVVAPSPRRKPRREIGSAGIISLVSEKGERAGSPKERIHPRSYSERLGPP